MGCENIQIIVLENFEYRDIKTNYILKLDNVKRIIGKICPNNEIISLNPIELIEAKLYYAKYGILLN